VCGAAVITVSHYSKLLPIYGTANIVLAVDISNSVTVEYHTMDVVSRGTRVCAAVVVIEQVSLHPSTIISRWLYHSYFLLLLLLLLYTLRVPVT